MPASLTFKKQDQVTNATAVNEIKTIVYEDSTGNKYTFGVDDATNVFNTFKYDPNGADPEVDYSATATKFMTGGAVAALLGIGTNVGEIKTKTDKITDTLGADVIAIKAKTDTIPADLTAKVTAIETATNAAHLGNKLGEIKTKTDFIPDTFTADVTAIKAKTDKITDTLGADVIAIKAKTDTIPADLTAKVTAIETATNAAHLGDKLTAINTKTDFIPDTFTADVTAIKVKTEKIPADLGTELASLAKSSDVTAIKTKTDKMPDNLVTELGNLAKSADVTAIKAKTDKMPADLNTELTKLTVIGSAINNNGHVTAAAKAVLENSFKQAITDAGTDGSNWLKNEVKTIVSQPSFEIPTEADAALNWTW